MIVQCPFCEEDNQLASNKIDASKSFRCYSCKSVVPFNEIETNQPVKRSEKPTVDLNNQIHWSKGVQFKMSTALMLITTTIIVLFVAYSFISEKKQKIMNLSEFAKVTTKRMAGSLKDPFWNIDKQMINDIILSEMEQKRIFSVAIKDIADNSVVFGKTRNSSWLPQDYSDLSPSNTISENIPISRDGTTIGHLEVHFTQKFMNEALRSALIKHSLSACILLFVIVTATAVILRRMIVLPIIKLSDATLMMSVGDLSSSLHTRSEDEIGLLSQSIERVQTSMRLALKKLQK